MYSNNILNFQESMTILNAYTKKSGNLLTAPHRWVVGKASSWRKDGHKFNIFSTRLTVTRCAWSSTSWLVLQRSLFKVSLNQSKSGDGVFCEPQYISWILWFSFFFSFGGWDEGGLWTKNEEPKIQKETVPQRM